MDTETTTRRHFWQRRDRVEDRTLTKDSVPGVFFGEVGAVEGISTKSAMGLADVFACVSVLASGAAMCPIQSYRANAQGQREQVEDAAAALLDNPAPGLTQPELVIQMVSSLALTGECFLGKYKMNGEVTSLRLLPADRMDVEVVAGQPRFTYRGGDGTIQENLTLDDVIFVRGLTLDGVRGCSPIRLCREAVGVSKALTESNAAFWQNGGLPSGIITVPPGPQAEEQVANVTKAFSERHAGPKNAGRVAGFSGEVAYTPLSLAPKDAEFVESRKLSTTEIARLFLVPPSRINAPSNDSLTYSTTAAEAEAFVKWSLGPWCRLIESAVSADADLYPAPSSFAKFNFDALLRGSTAERYAALKTAIDAGILTIDEARAIEDLPPRTREESEVPSSG